MATRFRPISFPMPDRSRRNSRGDGERLDIARDDAPGSNHRAPPDAHSFEDHHTGSQPDLVLDPDGLDLHRLLMNQGSHAGAVVAVGDEAVRPNQAMAADLDALVSIQDGVAIHVSPGTNQDFSGTGRSAA